MRHIFIIDGGNAAEEFPFGSMLYSFSSTKITPEILRKLVEGLR